MYKIFITAMVFLFSINTAFAYGPSSIAFSDRSKWPEKIIDSESFDRASIAEILVFTSVFNEKEKMRQDELRKWLNMKSVSMNSVKKWRKKTAAILLQNYRIAVESSKNEDFLCSKSVKSFNDLSQMASGLGSKIPASHKSWYENSRAFHEAYIFEQLRLAALFPEITSEIAKLGDEEIDGFEMRDKQFLLTFDDGPSEPAGTTDKLLGMLNKEKKTAIFYMLGTNLKQRLKKQPKTELTAIYKGMIIASHGMEHKSHSTWPNWKISLDDTALLLQNTFGKSYSPMFRPPYGKRSQELLTYAKSKGIKTMLWNIDSQDWNSKISADQVSNRVLTLMLLWRHGIILFHDIHDKAVTALPDLFKIGRYANVEWVNNGSFLIKH